MTEIYDKTKNAASDGANIESGKELHCDCHTNITPAPYSNTKKSGMQVTDLLPQGAENAVSVNDLLRLTGISNSRALQVIIAREREAGALILSTARNGGGYFLPDKGDKGKQEIAAFVRTLYARAVHTLKALKAAKQALDVLEGQETIQEEREE